MNKSKEKKEVNMTEEKVWRTSKRQPDLVAFKRAMGDVLEELGVTHDGFAEMACVARPTITAWTRGLTKPRAAALWVAVGNLSAAHKKRLVMAWARDILGEEIFDYVSKAKEGGAQQGQPAFREAVLGKSLRGNLERLAELAARSRQVEGLVEALVATIDANERG